MMKPLDAAAPVDAFGPCRGAAPDRGLRPSLGFRFSHQFLSGDDNTRSALSILDRKLADRGFEGADRENVELVLAEVLNNLAEHAYVPPGGPVDLSLVVTRDGLVFRIADLGAPVPDTVLSEPRLPVTAEGGDMPEGGWGWYIVHALSQDISYARDGSWNVLRLTIPWAMD